MLESKSEMWFVKKEAHSQNSQESLVLKKLHESAEKFTSCPLHRKIYRAIVPRNCGYIFCSPGLVSLPLADSQLFSRWKHFRKGVIGSSWGEGQTDKLGPATSRHSKYCACTTISPETPGPRKKKKERYFFLDQSSVPIAAAGLYCRL